VIGNLSSLYSSNANNSSVDKKDVILLPNPHGCPREVRDLMCECWQREEKERPSFREIHLFLMRKNLGYDPSREEDDEDVEDVSDDRKL
jgi:hypothetical protein